MRARSRSSRESALGALDFAEGHEHLADADESARLATTIAEASVRSKALLEGSERARFVVRRVDEQPAELVERIRSLSVVGQPLPGRDRVIEMSSAALDVAESRQELAGGCEGARACPLVGHRGARGQPRGGVHLPRGARATARTSRGRQRGASQPRRLRPTSASRARSEGRRDRARAATPIPPRARSVRHRRSPRASRSSRRADAGRSRVLPASSSSSAANSRMVSSRRKRSSPMAFRRLASTSVAS